MAAEADPRWQQLRAAFRVELEERARELNRLLLRLEQTPDAAARRETFDALFRQAHNLKGAARAVGMAEVEGLAHALESSLDSARRAESHPSPGWFDSVYGAVDALGPGGMLGLVAFAAAAFLVAAALAPPEVQRAD